MTTDDIEKMVDEMENTKFPKSGMALTIFIFKVRYISTSIMRCCEVEDYYSACILFRSLLEHYFRHLYIYTRTLAENSDVTGEEYYGKLKGCENFAYIRSMQNLNKKIKEEGSSFKLEDRDNEELLKVGKKFEIKNILSFLNEGINVELKPAFEGFFTGYCKKYYDLSSFVHGGPFAESYIRMYSNNEKGMRKDLEYFSTECIFLLNQMVGNTKLFFDMTKNIDSEEFKESSS